MVAISAVLTPLVLLGLVNSVGNVLPLQVAMSVPLLLIVALVATGRSKTPRLRSIWLGVVIGVGVFTVVGGGRCMELLNPLGY